MSDPIELLPCPMCSGELIKGKRWGDYDYLQNAQCNSCLVTFSIHYLDKDGASVLNRRANRWHAFSDEELKCLWPVNNEFKETEQLLTDEIDAELARRKGEA